MKDNGFSLVELSIVLVILGLLIGGILTGQNLVRAAELRRVPTEFQAYQTAVYLFKDKYLAIPGDMRNAIQFWGAADSAPVTCLTTAGTGKQTCNGDGDGRIDNAGAANRRSEAFMFWEHLANAELITGEYTGIAGPATATDVVLGENAPRSKLGNAGWSVEYVVTGDPGTVYQLGEDYGNTFIYGAESASWQTTAAILLPEEAWNIDIKVDDGKPAKGKLIARFWNNVCAAADDGTHANNDLEASYKLSETTVLCSLMLRNAI